MTATDRDLEEISVAASLFAYAYATEEVRPDCEYGMKLAMSASTGPQPRCTLPATWVAHVHRPTDAAPRHVPFLLFCDTHRQWLDTLPHMTCRQCGSAAMAPARFFPQWTQL
jgi:hypothetical protein